MSSKDSFGARDTLKVGDNSYEIYRLDAVPGNEKLPYSLKVLAENLLRTEDGTNITKEHIEAIANWDPSADPSVEIQFTPARVIMQDFTGVPCIVDLATMREAVGDLGGDPDKVNPLAPADLVIDHSVIADLVRHRRTPSSAMSRSNTSATASATSSCAGARAPSTTSRWCRPGTGIVHQVNIEYLARVVWERGRAGEAGSGDESASRTRTPAWAPTHTPRWRTVSGCWAGASAASRPRPPCWASRCRC